MDVDAIAIVHKTYIAVIRDVDAPHRGQLYPSSFLSSVECYLRGEPSGSPAGTFAQYFFKQSAKDWGCEDWTVEDYDNEWELRARGYTNRK